MNTALDCTPAILGPAGRTACRIEAQGTQPRLIVLQCVIAKMVPRVLSAATHDHFLDCIVTQRTTLMQCSCVVTL